MIHADGTKFKDFESNALSLKESVEKLVANSPQALVPSLKGPANSLVDAAHALFSNDQVVCALEKFGEDAKVTASDIYAIATFLLERAWRDDRSRETSSNAREPHDQVW